MPASYPVRVSMSTAMNDALWAAQWILALGFLAAGGVKLVAYDWYARMVKQSGSLAVPRATAAAIGIAEAAGAAGVVLPMLLNVAPMLTAWAAFGLASVMLLAIGYHMRNREPAPAPIVLVVLAALVAFGRFPHG